MHSILAAWARKEGIFIKRKVVEKKKKKRVCSRFISHFALALWFKKKK